MDVRQLQYFIRVYEERSFSRAAEKAHVVQPALSMQIRRLEDELSSKLRPASHQQQSVLVGQAMGQA